MALGNFEICSSSLSTGCWTSAALRQAGHSRVASRTGKVPDGQGGRVTTNEQFQAAIIEWLGQQRGTVLVPTRRLAHALRHRMREGWRRAGETGWQRPHIETLNQFVRRCWRDSWPVEGVAATFARLRLLHELIDELPPPDGLRRTVALPRQVDETFHVLVRHGLDPAADSAHTPLSAWRARICGRFAAALEQRRLVHPAALPTRVARAIDEGAVRVPEKILVAGLSMAAPIETQLLDTLARQTEVEHLPLPEGKPADLTAVTLPQQDQELTWLGQQGVQTAASGVPLCRIGIVLPDIPGYQEPVDRMLGQILGSAAGEQTYYNVALSRSLAEQPLVRAGMLLVELATKPDRERLVELLLCPYYAAWQQDRAQMGRADIIWREAGLGAAGLAQLHQILSSGDEKLGQRMTIGSHTLPELLEPLAPTSGPDGHTRRLSARNWIEALRAAWSQLGYPLLANEADRNAHNKLLEVIESVAGGLADLELTAQDLQAWLVEALASESTTTSGHELAGIQVVGLIESRGLCFDRLFVPGMTATALPRPVRALPLLSADERRHVRGGTAQSERAFSQAAFGNMLACADAVALSRPLTSGREPLAASPFWPTHVETEAPDLRFWASPDRAWLNAGWVEQAWRGLGQAPQGDQEGLALGVLPDELAATAVESLLRCPLGFLVKNLLKLGPLEDPQPGIDARKRGSIVHEILERFVNVVRAQKLDLIAHAPQCEGLLRKTASAVIDEQGGGWAWDVERRRLVGHAGAGDNGLLGKWLVKQREWWQQGWRFCATEVEFRGVELEGVPFRIRGSIDSSRRTPRRRATGLGLQGGLGARQ